MIVYLALKLITTTTWINDDARVNSISTVMLVCLYSVIVISILFAIYSLLYVIYSTFRELFCIKYDIISEDEIEKKREEMEYGVSLSSGMSSSGYASESLC